MLREQIINKLKELTNYKHLELVTRGNSAIDSALSLIEKGKTVLIPEEGGWIHYKKGPVKFGLSVIELKCDDAKIDLEDLKEKVKDAAAILFHNPGGYFVAQPIKEIYQICNENDCLVIMDVAGSVGTELCDGNYADIIVGSFGRWKLIPALVGGFISTNNQDFWDKMKLNLLDDEEALETIWQKLAELPQRIKFLEEKRKKVLKDLAEFNVLHKDSFATIIVVKFDSEEEKEKIIKYCEEENYEWTECPRYIRINSQAISIEIKRL
jgi:aspartate aminotransferase-like enzyme